MDATLITEARTGAMTAVGARYLARPDAKVLGHAGARGTAFSNVTMLDEIFDLDEIRVTSRRAESREAFARAAASGDLRRPVRVTGHRRGGLRRRRHPRRGDPAHRARAPAAHRRGEPGAFVVPYGTVSAVELDLLDVMDKVVVDDWREAQVGPASVRCAAPAARGR